MPNKKTPSQTKKKSPKTVAKQKQVAPKKKTAARTTRARQSQRTSGYSAEYLDYLKRYKMAGGDRPLLSPKEFDRLDDELLDLLALDLEVGLDDEQVVRLQELEYLLLESEQ
ncbi:MAG: hypothetical protein N2559_09850 [Anaerolineae bacterium]|nr:hypothetical protein [Anaerolineae bacterium]